MWDQGEKNQAQPWVAIWRKGRRLLKGILRPEKRGVESGTNRIDMTSHSWCFLGQFKGPWIFKLLKTRYSV
jgi:hypothetical protein